MTEFETALEFFLEGRLEFAGLQAVLKRSLEANPASASQNMLALQELYKTGRLPGQLYAALAEQISPQPPVAPPTSPTGPEITSPTGRTESTQPPVDPVAEPQDDGDKTRLKMPSTSSASQSPPSGQQSSDPTRITQTGASVSQQQWPTGTSGTTGATGSTGATGATGSTGSSWGDFGQWSDQPAPNMQTGAMLKDRFILEEEIGHGGMGVIFKARDVRKEEAQDRNPFVAVKILNDEFRRHPESLKALQRESRKAQDLAHPNIVTVFDFDRDGPIVYMTMEYMEGESLDRVIKRPSFQGLPPAEALPLIGGLSQALAYAHNKGIVHSDFKPGNVFLTKDGSTKVFDFGIARASKLPDDKGGEMTRFDPGTLGALTPAYASCEMLDGEEPDPRDDIYALACVSYELLTGKHPFSKRPASDARDKGLSAAPVPGLTRRQWRGLQRGLAFRREDRSPNALDFLEELRIRKLGKAQIAVGAAAAVAVIVFVIVLGPSFLQDRRIDNMVASISDSSDVDVPGVLQRLRELDATDQDIVTRNSQVEDRLIDYFDSQISIAKDAYDFPRAEALLAEAQALYDDSNTLAMAGDGLERDKAELLAELNSRYNSNLQAGRILPSDEDGISDVLEMYEKIDPQNPALTDPQLAIAYADSAEQALANDLARAGLFIDEGQRRFPLNARLVGLRDRLDTLRDVQDRAARVAELEQQLSSTLASLLEIDDFRVIESDLLQLEALDPTNRVVADYRGRVQGLLDPFIATAIANNDWAGARGAVESNTRLLTQAYRTAALSNIDAAESDFNEQVGGAYADVAEAVKRGDFSAAETYLSQLQKLNTAESTVRQARETISRGYLDAARSERGANRFDEARAKVKAGQAVDPSFPEWERELAAVASAEQLQAKGMEEQEREALEQQRLARVGTLQDSIQQNLARSSFTVENARETLGQIDELAGLDPTAELSRQGRSEVAAKLASEARAIGIQNQKYEDALKLVSQGIELLPAERSLRQAQSELQSQRDTYLARAAAEQEGDLKATLERLLKNPAYNSAWEADLRRSIQGLEPLSGNAEYLGARRQDIAALYVARASSLRAEERFDLAERMLTSSEWFVSGFGPAEQERQVLADEKRAFDAANQKFQLSAQVDGLKRTFATELNAEAIPAARRALAKLRDLLPRSDNFVTGEAPQAIADTYSRMATRALNRGDFDQAEQLVREGLKEVAKHQALTELLADIKPKRLQSNRQTLERIIKESAPDDAAGPKSMLAKIQSDAGARYSTIEAELRKLADARVLNSRGNQDAVVAWLGKIFVGYAAPGRSGPPCKSDLAGYGSRARGQCYDYLPGSSDEGPRLVVIPAGNGVATPFAIGRQEISVGQWNAYCRLSGNCAPRSGQRENVPITNIGVNEAKAYATWLSGGTKHTYRLPTSAEWEHAATADGSARISPNCINPQAGLLGDELLEVNRGGQNKWGIMNYVGNAQEWVTGSSGGYEARGGAYKDRLGSCVIELSRPHAGNADELTGFRLVRELGEDA